LADYQVLINRAKTAARHARAPFSNFAVGAAIQTHEGKIYSGCNIENSSFGLTICAERVAIFKAISAGAKKFTAIAITSLSKKSCPPCGACRQVLWELAGNIDVVMVTGDDQIQHKKLAELFPFAFNEDFF
jgi:cytidine deaminase